MSKLYIVATPIGNLDDITLRALDTFKKVDLILCEDTRVTKKLLNHYNIKTSVESYHQHSKIKKINKIKNLLKQGKNLALASDSGTPGISDPGNKLIEFLISLPRRQADSFQFPVKIIPVPGPSALTTAASISGFPMDKFIFMGFPPHKKGRNKFFKKVLESEYSVIIYESPYRIIKTLKELEKKEVVVSRELTKKFETIYRGKAENIIKQITPKGEFTIIVNKK